ncbi:MAG: hypothetical protein HQL52_11170, partial [Magnetococcales bacterium]|nr:hypothetical protein [Magnetococcales bacterium]
MNPMETYRRQGLQTPLYLPLSSPRWGTPHRLAFFGVLTGMAGFMGMSGRWRIGLVGALVSVLIGCAILVMVRGHRAKQHRVLALSEAGLSLPDLNGEVIPWGWLGPAWVHRPSRVERRSDQ